VADDLPINDVLVIPGAELEIRFSRSGGPGGQNVNKVETKAEVRWVPAESNVLNDSDRQWLLNKLGNKLSSDGALIVTSTKTREQAKNLDDARTKLASMVAAALVRPKKRKRTKPSKGAVERRLQEKKQKGQRKRNRRAPRRDD
jgi:ribosome-associated protein